MSQTNALLERMTAWENYRFYGAVNSMTSKECRKSFSLASGYFGLDRFRNKRVEELTAGWKQLLSFSIAVMSMPKVLLLDEPTAGVDALTRESIWNSVREMVRNGCCAVVTSHYRWEVGLCDRELVIERRTH
jgi:ABC-2 type transport system ATP-binding protein